MIKLVDLRFLDCKPNAHLITYLKKPIIKMLTQISNGNAQLSKIKYDFNYKSVPGVTGFFILPIETFERIDFKFSKISLECYLSCHAFKFDVFLISKTHFVNNQGDDFDPANFIDYYHEIHESTIDHFNEINDRYLKSKPKNIEGYPFIVKVIDTAVDIVINLVFKEDLNSEQKQSIIVHLSKEIEIENNKAEQNNQGLIHSISNLKFQKNTSSKLQISIDLGSSGQEGMFFVFKSLSVFDEILMIEVNSK
jgi:hypothetical protein